MTPSSGSSQREAAAREFDRALALLNEQRWDEAEVGFRAALALRPDFAEAEVNLGFIAQRRGSLKEAARAYEHALALRPDLPTAQFNLGNVRQGQRDLRAAEAAFRAALQLRPDYPEALLNLATVLVLRNELQEAEPLVRRALVLRPGYAEAHANLGNILMNELRLDEALAECHEALLHDPMRAEVRLNRAYAHLLAGDFRLGWPDFEFRWHGAPTQQARVSRQPPWLGREPVAGRVLLVTADAGIGDMIQFARYAPLLAARGAEVHFEVPDPLVPLLTGLPFLAGVHRRDGALPRFDLHCPFMSLALAFDTRLDSIPAPLPLAAPPASRDRWQTILGPRKAPRVGLTWSGNPSHRADHNRSIPLATMRELTRELPGIHFCSLQHEVRPTDAIDASPEIDNLARHGIGAFDDAAGLVEQMDLVISVDTAIAHLAATMGKPVWLLLPHFPDWRWMLDRTDSPWYPTMRLFRQTRRGNWPTILQSVRDELQAWGAGFSV